MIERAFKIIVATQRVERGVVELLLIVGRINAAHGLSLKQ